jgi:hypothetical protein
MTDDREILIAEMNELLEKADNIEHQLEMSEARQIKERHSIDPVWRAKALYALKATRRDVSRIQAELANRKRSFAKKRQLTFERQFVLLSRHVLDSNTYEQLLQKAGEAMEETMEPSDSGTQNLHTQSP